MIILHRLLHIRVVGRVEPACGTSRNVLLHHALRSDMSFLSKVWSAGRVDSKIVLIECDE